MSLYFWILLLSVSLPLIFTFHPRIRFYRIFKWFVPSLLITMIGFIVWDSVFTIHGIWGFNHEYTSHIRFLELPIEEWLFFIAIPYACVFTHYTIVNNTNWNFTNKTSAAISSIIIMLLLAQIVVYTNRWYTVINATVCLFIIGWVFYSNRSLLNNFYTSFGLILIPFLIVNGILTGSFITDEVVWYNNEENMGMRFFTIPFEDFFYAFSLLLANVYLTEAFKNYKRKLF